MMTVSAIIGGMVSSTILTLLVIPVLYALWRWKAVKRRQQHVPI